MRCARSQADGALSSRPRSGACRRADRVRSTAPPCVVSFVASGDCSDVLLEQGAGTAAIVVPLVSAAWARCGEVGDRCSKLARADRATCQKIGNLIVCTPIEVGPRQPAEPLVN